MYTGYTHSAVSHSKTPMSAVSLLPCVSREGSLKQKLHLVCSQAPSLLRQQTPSWNWDVFSNYSVTTLLSGCWFQSHARKSWNVLEYQNHVFNSDMRRGCEPLFLTCHLTRCCLSFPESFSSRPAFSRHFSVTFLRNNYQQGHVDPRWVFALADYMLKITPNVILFPFFILLNALILLL